MPSSVSGLKIIRMSEETEIHRYLPSLQSLLQLCVNEDPSKSSIRFLAPLHAEKAAQFWWQLIPSLSGPTPEAALLLATCGDDGRVVATVMVARMLKETHDYRGEVRKLLVHPEYRKCGIGRCMMDQIEAIARDVMKLELLVLDTATETPARVFYQNTGWTEWGICPDYAKFADGMKGHCSFFYKRI